MRAGGREWLVVSSAALGLMISACIDGGDKDNDRGYSPVLDGGAPTGGTSGTGGTPGGVAGPTGGVGGPTGGVGGTTGGVAGPTGGVGGTTGGVAGPTGGTGGTTGGVAGPTGGTGGTTGGVGGTTGGTTGGTGGTMGGGTPGGAAAVKGTGTSCTASQAATGGKCGSYYCGVDQATLASALNASKPCGTNAQVACKATLTGIVTKCAGTAQTNNIVQLALGDTSGFKREIEMCVAANSEVTADAIPTTCQACFTQAAVCCAGNDECAGACLGATETKMCEDAQKAAGCVNAVFDCAGLPDPF